jgi:hypothetical protein
MFKNIGSQKIALFAFDTTTGAPKTGDAANITAYVNKDFAGASALGDTSATEIDATNAKGWYLFDLTQAETNGDALVFTGKSSTANVSVVGQLVYTVPANFTAFSVDSNGRTDVIKVAGTSQTAGDICGKIGTPSNLGGGTATLAGNLSDIEAQTDDIGTAGAGLTAIPDSAGVTTLLSRIPSALFSGITSLAQWLGLLAGKQTGNSTARTEIRATGGGSGTYDETTDSQEALRDQTGSGLTAIPWNAAWDAEVQSEVDDALVAKNLDRLVTVAGTADSGSTTTMVDAARTEGDADYWKGSIILFTSGSIAGQARMITDFNQSTDTFTFTPALTQSVGTQTYVILPAVSVWDDVMAEHLGSGTTGSALNAAGSAGDPWATSLPGAYGAGTAGKIIGDVGPNVTTVLNRIGAFTGSGVNTILGFFKALLSKAASTPSDVGGTFDPATDSTEALRDYTGTGLTAIPWNSAWDAEVQSEVDDALIARNLDKLVSVNGTADSGSTTTMVDAARTEADADYWKGSVIVFTSGNIAGQTRMITDFNAGTDTFTFAPATTQAVSTQNYIILPKNSVWDDVLAEHLGSGSTGNALNAAGSAGDPWATALPGAYGSGTAGKIVGDNINATISSRLASASYTAPDNSSITAIKAKTDQLVFTLTNKVDASIQAAGDFAQAAADKVWSSTTRTLSAFSFAVDISAAAVSLIWDKATSALTTVGSIGKLFVDNINATISSRLASASYTAPDNTSITAIKAKTDNLPSDPADASDVAASFSSIAATLATIAAYIDTEVAAIKAKTDNLPATPAAAGDAMALTSAERNSTADAIFTRTLGTEAYASDGSVPTFAQMQFMLWSALAQFGITSTTISCKKLDGTTEAMTFTLDSSSSPTSRTRTT